MTYYKTIITTTILSEGPYTFHNLQKTYEDMTEGDVSGEVLTARYWISMEGMAMELDGQGSDPTFLLGEDWDSKLDDRQAARDNFNNTYHYTSQMSDGIYTLQIEIDEPIATKISITSSRDSLDLKIERHDSPNLITYTDKLHGLANIRSCKLDNAVFRDMSDPHNPKEYYCSSMNEALSLLGVYPEECITSLITKMLHISGGLIGERWRDYDTN